MTSFPPILIVDDDPTDLQTLAELVRKAKLPNPVELFSSGEDVIAHLERWSAQAARLDRSALLLLDLRMPRLSGFDVLAWVRRHPRLHEVVVVMVSHINESGDSERALRLGAQSYLLKWPAPLTIAALAKLVEHAHA